MQNLNKIALAMSLAACMSFGFIDKAHAEEAMPSSGVAYENLDREITKLELSYSLNNNDWAAVTDLSLLYYDRKEFKNCYNMSKKALKLYQNGYAYANDDDIFRETLVKGAAAAYNMGRYTDAENMLNKMIGLRLGGSEDNQKTYMGWAYYYLSNIERVRGNINRSHYYGGIAINYCPRHSIFLDYWGGFYCTGSIWYWRHHHHDYRPPMPPPRPVCHPRPVHRPVPNHTARPPVDRPVPNHTVRPDHVHQKPVFKQNHGRGPVPQKDHTVNQSRPVNNHTVQHQTGHIGQRPVPKKDHSVNQSRPVPPKPVFQQGHNGRPVNHGPIVSRPAPSKPAVNQSRPAPSRPAPQKKNVSQSKPALEQPIYQQGGAVSRPAPQRPAGHTMQHPSHPGGPRR